MSMVVTQLTYNLLHFRTSEGEVYPARQLPKENTIGAGAYGKDRLSKGEQSCPDKGLLSREGTEPPLP